MTFKKTPNEQQAVQLAITTCNQAMKIVVGDTVIRNHGVADRDLIRDEINRRLVEPLSDYLRTPYTDNRIAEIWTSMACTHPHYWMESDGNGQWMFKNGGWAKMENYFQSGPRNFGFESADELLDLLDLFTEPFDPDPKPEPPALSEPSFKDTLAEIMKNSLIQMIKTCEDNAERLKAILEKYYPEA